MDSPPNFGLFFSQFWGCPPPFFNIVLHLPETTMRFARGAAREGPGEDGLRNLSPRCREEHRQSGDREQRGSWRSCHTRTKQLKDIFMIAAKISVQKQHGYIFNFSHKLGQQCSQLTFSQYCAPQTR